MFAGFSSGLAREETHTPPEHPFLGSIMAVMAEMFADNKHGRIDRSGEWPLEWHCSHCGVVVRGRGALAPSRATQARMVPASISTDWSAASWRDEWINAGGPLSDHLSSVIAASAEQ